MHILETRRRKRRDEEDTKLDALMIRDGKWTSDNRRSLTWDEQDNYARELGWPMGLVKRAFERVVQRRVQLMRRAEKAARR
jgi:hypothetical protein